MQREPRISEKERKNLHRRCLAVQIKLVAVEAGINPVYLRTMFSAYGSITEKHAARIDAALTKMEKTA